MLLLQKLLTLHTRLCLIILKGILLLSNLDETCMFLEVAALYTVGYNKCQTATTYDYSHYWTMHGLHVY